MKKNVQTWWLFSENNTFKSKINKQVVDVYFYLMPCQHLELFSFNKQYKEYNGLKNMRLTFSKGLDRFISWKVRFSSYCEASSKKAWGWKREQEKHWSNTQKHQQLKRSPPHSQCLRFSSCLSSVSLSTCLEEEEETSDLFIEDANEERFESTHTCFSEHLFITWWELIFIHLFITIILIFIVLIFVIILFIVRFRGWSFGFLAFFLSFFLQTHTNVKNISQPYTK